MRPWPWCCAALAACAPDAPTDPSGDAEPSGDTGDPMRAFPTVIDGERPARQARSNTGVVIRFHLPSTAPRGGAR